MNEPCCRTDKDVVTLFCVPNKAYMNRIKSLNEYRIGLCYGYQALPKYLGFQAATFSFVDVVVVGPFD